MVSTRFEKRPERFGRRVCDCATEGSNERETNVNMRLYWKKPVFCVTGQPNTNMILTIAMIVTYRYMLFFN